MGGVRNAPPAGATLDLNFMFPGSLPPGVTFSRASPASYQDASGVIQTAAVDQPRWDYAGGSLRGLLIEEARTNLLLNSATLGTQSVAVTAQAYTLSFYGTGTVTKSGAATGALVGTGVGQRVSQTFTPTAGTLTCTVTGSVLNAQIEAGSFATSWITTAGATATRAQDVMSMPLNASWFDPAKGSLVVDYMVEGVNPSLTVITPAQLVGAANNFILVDQCLQGTATAPQLYIGNVNVAAGGGGNCQYNAVAVSAGVVHRGAVAWAANAPVGGAHDGVGPFSQATITAVPPLTDLTFATFPGQGPLCMWVQRARYWPRQLSQAELISVTT